MQEYNVPSYISTEDSSDEGESDDPDERDRRSHLPQSSQMTGQHDALCESDKEVSYSLTLLLDLNINIR